MTPFFISFCLFLQSETLFSDRRPWFAVLWLTCWGCSPLPPLQALFRGWPVGCCFPFHHSRPLEHAHRRWRFCASEAAKLCKYGTLFKRSFVLAFRDHFETTKRGKKTKQSAATRFCVIIWKMLFNEDVICTTMCYTYRRKGFVFRK